MTFPCVGCNDHRYSDHRYSFETGNKCLRQPLFPSVARILLVGTMKFDSARDKAVIPQHTWFRARLVNVYCVFTTLRAKLSSTVYCYWSCLVVCLWVCYHDNSKMHASTFTKLGL